MLRSIRDAGWILRIRIAFPSPAEEPAAMRSLVRRCMCVARLIPTVIGERCYDTVVDLNRVDYGGQQLNEKRRRRPHEIESTMNDKQADGSHGDLEAHWRCQKCLRANQTRMAPPGAGPWTCEGCGEVWPVRAEAVGPGGELRSCPVCTCPDLYRQRDFNRKLGIAIIILGAVLAPATHYISLVLFALIDFGIYWITSNVAVCHHCRSIFRRYPGIADLPPFDLNTSDKYLEIERKRGW